jgi:hypothetical protein
MKQQDLFIRNQKILHQRLLRNFIHFRESYFPRDLLLVTDSALLGKSQKKILNFALSEKIKYLHKIENEYDQYTTLATTNIFIERVSLYEIRQSINRIVYSKLTKRMELQKTCSERNSKKRMIKTLSQKFHNLKSKN